MVRGHVRLGIIGCGAAARICHLPAARRTQDVDVVALADKNLAHAQALGRQFGIENCTEDYHRFVKDVDGIIVCLPNYLHVPVGEELLRMGVPVLMEKPLAPTADGAMKLIALASEAGVPLQVGHRFRFSKAARLTKRVIDEGWLGPLRSFSLEFGEPFSWPVASPFFSRKEQAEGGVLIDTGSHMLDLLLWWLGDVVDVEYRDDNLGGVEADCQLSLALRGPAGVVRGDVLLSRLRTLSRTAHLAGEDFVLECNLSGPYEVCIRPSTWDVHDPLLASRFDPHPDTFGGMFVEQLLAFAQAIRDGSPPVVSGETILGTVALIERCYRERKPLAAPWHADVTAPSVA